MKLIFGFPLKDIYKTNGGYFREINFKPSEEDPIVTLSGIKGLEFRTDEKMTPRGSKSGLLSIIDEAKEHEILHKKTCDNFDIKQVCEEGKTKVSTTFSKVSKLYQPFKTSKIRIEESIGTIVIDFKTRKIYIKNSNRHPQSDREYKIAEISDTRFNPFKYFASYLLSPESNIKKNLYFAYGNDEHKKSTKYWLYFVAEGVPTNIAMAYLKLTKERKNINIFMNENKTICISTMNNLLTMLFDIPILANDYQHILDAQVKIDDKFRRAYESKIKSRNRLSPLVLLTITEIEYLTQLTKYDEIIADLLRVLYWRNGVYKDADKFTKIKSITIDKNIFDMSCKAYDTIENHIRNNICKIIIDMTAKTIKNVYKSECPTTIKDQVYFECSSESLWTLLNTEGFNSFASVFTNELNY